MKKSIVCFLFFAIYFGLTGQNYTPYSFENYQTEWTHYSFEESLFGDVQSYGLEDKIITNSSVYLVYKITSTLWYYNGFMIEKLDLLSGELKWRYHKFERSFYNRDFPSKVSLKDNGTVALSCFRQIQKENQNVLWYKSHMSTWVFDEQTGMLLDTIVTEASDSNNVEMIMPVNLISSSTTSSFIHHIGNDIKYVKSLLYYPYKIGINSYDLSLDGHVISEYYKEFLYKYEKPVWGKTLRLNDDKIFNFRKSETSSKDSFNIEITIMDNKLNVISSKNLTDNFQGEFHALSYVGDSVFCVTQYGERITPDLPDRYQKVYTFDFEGNLIEQVALELDNEPLYTLHGFNVMYIEELAKTLIVSLTRNEKGAFWEWFITNDNAELEKIGEIKLRNSEEEFLWSFYTPVYMDWLGDGKILLHALHSKTGSNTTGASIPSISIFSLEKLDGTLSIIEEKKEKNTLLFPNPVGSSFKIKESEIEYSSFIIYSVKGEIVKKGNLYTEKEINVEKLLSGLYFVKLIDRKNNVTIEKMNKI